MNRLICILVLPSLLVMLSYSLFADELCALPVTRPATHPVATADEDLLAFIRTNKTNLGVVMPDEKEFYNIRIKRAVDELKEYPQPWSVKKVIAWYKHDRNADTRANFLWVMAASRSPAAAVQLGPSLTDEELPVRVAAAGAIVDYYNGLAVAGGTEEIMAAAADWWAKNKPVMIAATQASEDSAPYRRLYVQYKDSILKFAQAGDADGIDKLTAQFNETLGSTLLYVRVQRPLAGKPGEWEMVFNKSFSNEPIKMPTINYPESGNPNVSFWDGFVLVLPAKVGNGKYEDDVYITMAIRR